MAKLCIHRFFGQINNISCEHQKFWIKKRPIVHFTVNAQKAKINQFCEYYFGLMLKKVANFIWYI